MSCSFYHALQGNVVRSTKYVKIKFCVISKEGLTNSTGREMQNLHDKESEFLGKQTYWYSISNWSKWNTSDSTPNCHFRYVHLLLHNYSFIDCKLKEKCLGEDLQNVFLKTEVGLVLEILNRPWITTLFALVHQFKRKVMIWSSKINMNDTIIKMIIYRDISSTITKTLVFYSIFNTIHNTDKFIYT